MRALVISGIKVGLVTNRSSYVGAILRIVGVQKYFRRAIVGYWDVDKPKPHPDGLTTLRVRLGLKRRETLYVGDRPTDILAGKAARIGTVALDNGVCTEELKATHPDYNIESLIGLLPIVIPHYRDVIVRSRRKIIRSYQ